MVDKINKLSSDKFRNLFSNVAYLPLIAQKLDLARPFQDIQHLVCGIQKALDSLEYKEIIHLLETCPDLAGRLADEGLLTPESEAEQKAAGLHLLTKEEKRQLRAMNDRYRSKFGFTFIICARENKITSILSGLKTRLDNSKDVEVQVCLEEVKQIAALRALDIVKKMAIQAHPDPLSSHMLDITIGRPAHGVTLTLLKMGEKGVWQEINEKQTNVDGRASAFLSWDNFDAGLYKVHFKTAEYFKSQGKGCFYPYIEVVFNIQDATQHFHIAVLLSPFGYTTYRGTAVSRSNGMKSKL